MRYHAVFLSLLMIAVPLTTLAEGGTPPTHSALGPGVGVDLPADDRDECADSGSLFVNHDGSFEYAYAWEYGGVQEPYYGAFAEGLEGPAIVNCVQLRATTLPSYYYDQLVDIYVWGSDSDNPSNVLSVTTGVPLGSIPYWPSIGTYNISINAVSVPHRYFVGFWGDWPGTYPGFFVAADLDGPGGMPRTNVAPGVGYPTGWIDPSDVGMPAASLGIGAWGRSVPPLATGACCGSDGSCAITTRFDCESGDWRIDAPCEPSPCPPSLLGACCVEGVCTLTEEQECPAGSWLGPETHCEPNPCPESPEETADCVNYESYAHWMGGTTKDSPAGYVAAADGWVCVAGLHVLRVMDITDPRNPVTRGELPISGPIAASGHRLFVAAWDGSQSSLKVVDTSSPETPAILGSATLPGTGLSISNEGNLVCVLLRNGEVEQMVIADVSVAQHPVVVGSLDLVDHAYHVDVAGGYVYVANGSNGLTVVDVSNPRIPRIVTSLATPSYAVAVAVAGPRAYVADNEYGLIVVDVSDPANPQIIGSAAVPGYTGEVEASGPYAYLTMGEQESDDVVMFDVSDPRSPVAIGRVDLTCVDDYGCSMNLAISGTTLCVAMRPFGLQLIDVTNPRTASIVGGLGTRGWRLAVSGEYAYVGDLGEGLKVLDIHDPGAPRVVGSLPELDNCWEIAVAGTHAFVATWLHPGPDGHLVSVDVSDPAHPRVEGSIALLACPSGLAITGTYAVVASRWGDAFEDAYLKVVDISDPANMRIIGALTLSEEAWDVAASGDYVYLASGPDGLLAVDVSDPSNPRIVGDVGVQDLHALAVDVEGGLACVGLYGGVEVVDVSEPSNMRNLGFAYRLWRPDRVSIDGTHAAFACSYTGIQIVDLRDVWNPRFDGGVPGWGSGVAAANGYVYALCDSFQILRPPCESVIDDGDNASAGETPALLTGVLALQNPAVRQATIRLELTADGPVHATIHDLTGRRVRDLFSGRLPASTRDLTWDGRDDRGRDVGTGVYIARISTGAGAMTRRLVLLR